jgi:peptide/nickel transport system permease protein
MKKLLNQIVKDGLILLGTILLLISLVFVLTRVSGIDPVLSIVGSKSSEETYNKVKKELGLDQPVLMQLLNYIKKTCVLDFGNSFLTNNPVIDDLSNVFPATIELATISVMLSLGLGIPLGLIAAIYQGQWPDHVLRILCIAGSSMSVFWIGLMGLLIFYANLHWSAGPGRLSPEFLIGLDADRGFIILKALYHKDFALLKDSLRHIWLPAAVLAYVNLAYISRMTRSFVVDQLNQEYVNTCRIKGVSEFKILFVHCLPNIKLPLLTLVIMSYTFLLEGSALTETIYMWPGVGYYMTKALLSNDTNAIIGCTLLLGLIFMIANFLVDKINVKA